VAVQVFGRTQSGQGNGTVGKLTDNIVTRAAYYEHAIVMALIPFMNLKLYPEFGLATEE
jgi:non-canonical (house-cleaning) NTP pyrophosphatase